MRGSLLLLLVVIVCVNIAQARIYTCKDKDGNTIYTDNPTECAQPEEVKTDKLPTLIETKPLTTSPSSTSSSSTQKENNGYQALTITAPGNDTSIRDNSGVVNITFQASPALNTRRGHKYVVILGGKQVYKGTEGSVTVKNVDRGTHVVKATIVARNGRTLISSEPVSFTLHRYSRLQNTVNSANDGGEGGDNNEGNSGDGSNSFNIPTNTKLPQRPPPPPPPTLP